VRSIPQNDVSYVGKFNIEAIAGSLGYLEKRCARMRYAAFRAQGYPIGSWIVESAHQTEVHARRRGAGLLCARAKVLLSVRGLEGTDRWAEVWPVLTTRFARLAGGTGPAAPSSPSQGPAPAVPMSTVAASAPHRTGPRCPAANYPWHRLPIGQSCSA
jgi:hypothetical protein